MTTEESDDDTLMISTGKDAYHGMATSKPIMIQVIILPNKPRRSDKNLNTSNIAGSKRNKYAIANCDPACLY